MWSALHPDSPDTYEDNEQNCNDLIARIEDTEPLGSEEMCKTVLTVNPDMSMTGEAEYDAELMRLRNGNRPEVESEKVRFRDLGWTL